MVRFRTQIRHLLRSSRVVRSPTEASAKSSTRSATCPSSLPWLPSVGRGAASASWTQLFFTSKDGDGHLIAPTGRLHFFYLYIRSAVWDSWHSFRLVLHFVRTFHASFNLCWGSLDCGASANSFLPRTLMLIWAQFSSRVIRITRACTCSAGNLDVIMCKFVLCPWNMFRHVTPSECIFNAR